MTKPKFRVVTYPNGVIVGWAMNNAAFDFAIKHFKPVLLGDGFILNRKKA